MAWLLMTQERGAPDLVLESQLQERTNEPAELELELKENNFVQSALAPRLKLNRLSSAFFFKKWRSKILRVICLESRPRLSFDSRPTVSSFCSLAWANGFNTRLDPQRNEAWSDCATWAKAWNLGFSLKPGLFMSFFFLASVL